MKILFVTSAYGIDYEADCIFHGLVDSGHDVTDMKYQWYLSKPFDDSKRGDLYGLGFSLAGKLPDRSSIDRRADLIRDRIASKYYDVVLYGSVDRCTDYIDQVHQTYGKSRVGIIDGGDSTAFRDRYESVGVMFKREIKYCDIHRCVPVSYAIPRCNFLPIVEDKEKDFFRLIPGMRDTYGYTDESAYYRDMSLARFAITMRKGGWDCMRHYEIVAAGCVPFFYDIGSMPDSVMVGWPRVLQSDANRVALRYITGNGVEDDYRSTLHEFNEYGIEFLTTRTLARHVLSRLY